MDSINVLGHNVKIIRQQVLLYQIVYQAGWALHGLG